MEDAKRTAKPQALFSSDEFNNYFVTIADEIVNRLPVLQQDPSLTLTDHSTRVTLETWSKVGKSLSYFLHGEEI